MIKTNGDRKLADLLAEGAAYYRTVDDQAVTNDRVNTLENVKVVSHTHNGGKDGNGTCSICGKQMAASLTVGGKTSWYAAFATAIEAANAADGAKTITLYLTRQQAEELADVLLPVTDPLWHAPKGGEKLAFTVLGANGLSTLILWWLAIHQTQSYAPDAQTAALAQLGQLAAFAARWLPLGTAWLLVLAGTLFCISLVRSALQAVHYTVWRTDTQLGSRGGLVRRYEMRLRLSQLNYADLRRSPATWALHYCPVFVSAGACRPELPLFVWREGTPLLRELLPEMAQLPPDTCADTTDRSMVFFLPAGIPLALCLLLTAVSRTTLPALTLPLLIPTGVFAALLGAAAVGWHREGVWQQQGQLLLCRQHRFHLHQLCVFHPDTGFTALQSPWAVTVQRANLTLVFPGKAWYTVTEETATGGALWLTYTVSPAAGPMTMRNTAAAPTAALTRAVR